MEEEITPEYWEIKCYCDDEDRYMKIKIPYGTSSDEHFKTKPKCHSCGNTNLVPVVINHPANPPENTPNVKETDFK